MLNKKSQIEDWLPLLATIVFLVFIFLFSSLLNVNRKNVEKENLEFQILGKDSNQLLLNFLRASINLRNNEDITVADAIAYYTAENDKNLLNQIKKKAANIFSNSHLETDYSSWSLEVKHGDREEIIESEKARTKYIQRKEVSKIIIPSHEKDIIELKLFFVQTKFVAK